MADAAWTRRLATALLGDPSAAHDAQQDAWLTAREADPGDVANPRGWIRTVIANAMRSQRRSRLRRKLHEQDSLATSETAPSPEDLLARLEVQKTVAMFVTSLEEPGRQIVLLRYYEGLTSGQIAASMGIPPGTVRWRLKNALDDLRTQLERHHGERGQDWRLALLPLVGRREVEHATPAAAATLSRRSPGPMAAAAALGILVVVVLLGAAAGWPWRAGGSASPVGEARGNGAAAATTALERRPRGGRTGGGVPAFSALALARDCPEQIGKLDATVRRARDALAYYLPPRTAFHDQKDQPNDAGTAALAPIMNRWLDERGAPREGREMRCQGDACKVKVTEPWPPAPWVDRPPSAKTAAELAAISRDVQLDGPVKDDKSSLAETWVWVRLRALNGQPSDTPAPALPTALLPSGHTPPQAEGPPLTEACRTATAALAGEFESLRQRAHKELNANVLFDKEPATNPALAAKLQPVVDRVHHDTTPEGDRNTPLLVECRGLVCKVEPPAGVQVQTDTMKRLLDDKELATQVRRVSLVSKNGRADGPLYFTLLPPPDASRSGSDVLRHFVNRIRQENLLEGCKERAPGPGKLSVHLLLPASGETNDDGVPGRISFRLGESLADAPLGRCIGERLAASAATFELPADVTRADVTRTIEVP